MRCVLLRIPIATDLFCWSDHNVHVGCSSWMLRDVLWACDVASFVVLPYGTRQCSHVSPLMIELHWQSIYDGGGGWNQVSIDYFICHHGATAEFVSVVVNNINVRLRWLRFVTFVRWLTVGCVILMLFYGCRWLMMLQVETDDRMRKRCRVKFETFVLYFEGFWGLNIFHE